MAQKNTTTPWYKPKEFDTRTKDYKDAKWALENKDITKLDKRSKAYKIFNSLFDKQYGDAVKEMTDWLGFEQCDKCKERQKAWNRSKKEDTSVLVFKENTILSDDAQLLLQAIWHAHITTHRIDSDLVKAFTSLYTSIYKVRPECSSCGFMKRFNEVISL